MVLRDGTAGLLWPLLPTDRGTLRQGFAQLSVASRQRRFLTALSELSEPMLAHLVDGVDGVEHVALVLTVVPADGEARPVAVGRLVRHPDAATATACSTSGSATCRPYPLSPDPPLDRHPSYPGR